MNQTLHTRIVSPQQILFEGEANSVSSKNMQGAFDILPQHANFITTVENSPIIVRTQGQKPQAFKFPIAIIYTTRNTVNIYTYIQPQS
ncbi:hypothetical protein A3B42_03765 [Candidatus Daviesbacteria bacterium RIFCSPLOWO2_01_FULL_38_10]|uniref:ATP synthase F1 complex delta/epsilon subunit N-terminal domain-containing protein n=1 Tax=Candidatus Daviesbacteria bacterium GW2011_GWF2_38_6 TaxID=1618432 RepID=A0A0G0KQP3_9BACT|nr:MAG: hypothetical protein US80_C0007G0002 [Candidatus Daviesbacteria bacterium GW2011_GWA2_38_17]KKQ77795.1 MAG: hypothetical protein US99_C0034G0007 [Candidatus Daviesbacteria bacterium GW2011_GWF2_38_6]OGE27846.1 MAG: hypothetical protein A3D02_03735 [Candidatus Daviesbacteria bacterium RIFCSPHIGHO2_02_FULL_39_41]OGE37841.1 MAG: hypothetical protein A3B42_03765 [Candidatus Daviesbacteria bacterium RIFCSPLOWO2_01_FULL_38_10]OGE45043.1 MAG: hypothetical protein A3E67_00815 [Candidatus Davies